MTQTALKAIRMKSFRPKKDIGQKETTFSGRIPEKIQGSY